MLRHKIFLILLFMVWPLLSIYLKVAHHACVWVGSLVDVFETNSTATFLFILKESVWFINHYFLL